MENVGYMYLRGLGVPVDFNIAAAFFKAGAAEGHAQASFNLGNCYFSGQGVEQDYARAVAAWERAAGEGVEVIRGHLDAGRPVVIDFTVVSESDGKTERFWPTLLVVGYNVELDQFVFKNPNQPPPGMQLMSGEELKSNWYSRGYSRLGKGRVEWPLIVVGEG
ncbi:MAG: hypothetical protein P8J87_06880 [Verrucomicrobiales bacterium]|nr:hypothetical protein [Verrucomicrobiales bacterium]